MKVSKNDTQQDGEVESPKTLDSPSAQVGQIEADGLDLADVFGSTNSEPAPVPSGLEIEPVSPTRIDITPSAVIITIQSTEDAPTLITGTNCSIQILHKRKLSTSESVAALHVRISQTAFKKLRKTVGNLPAERGGIFVGTDPFFVEDFIFDCGSSSGRAVYYPDTTYLNGILEREHEPNGRRFIGLAHSHPNGYWHPSGDQNWGDVKAARNNLMSKSNSDLPALFIPIVESAATTGTFALHPFVMLRRDLRVHPARFEVID